MLDLLGIVAPDCEARMFMGIGEFMPTPDLAISVRNITRNASRRISRVAFEWALRRRKKKFGMVSMCIGGGMGIALAVER
jgi:isocitrate/isopropylmalate dehydrogenase